MILTMSDANRLTKHLYRLSASTGPVDYDSIEYTDIEPVVPDYDKLAEMLWKRMFEQPAVVQCGHCKAHNAFTNPSCVQCGAPMGDAEYKFNVEVRI